MIKILKKGKENRLTDEHRLESNKVSTFRHNPETEFVTVPLQRFRLPTFGPNFTSMLRGTFPIVLVLLVISCQENAPLTDSRTAFRYNQQNPITSLDPAFARTQNNIWAVDCLFNGLVQLDDSLNVKPCISSHWSISPDGLSYRFALRTDVFFHDDPAFPNGGKGRKLVASDVVYSFKRLVDEAWPKPGSWIFKGRVSADSAFVAENDSTFVLRLNAPFQPMLQILSMQYASVVPFEVCEFWGRDFRRHPVGTGPFKFKIWAENQALVLIRNDHYFERDSSGQPLPYLDAVKTTFIGDRKTAFLEFKKGNLDYFVGLESAYINELLTSEVSSSQRYPRIFIF